MIYQRFKQMIYLIFLAKTVDNTRYIVYYIICKEVRDMKKRKKKKATVEISIKINLYFVAFEYHISYKK